MSQLSLIISDMSSDVKPTWSRRNEDKDGAEVTLAGSAFDARAPATGNARSPSEDRRVTGTTPSVLEA